MTHPSFYRESRGEKIAKWVGIVLGIVFGLLIFVVAPMWKNYEHHGSVFIEQPRRTAP